MKTIFREFNLATLTMVSLWVDLQTTALVRGAEPSRLDERKVPTISIARTEASGISYWQPTMGDGLAQMLITELSRLPNFKVLESVALDDLRAERALGENGEVSEKERVKKGQWKGADYTFKSTITRFGCKESSFGGFGGLLRNTPLRIGEGFAVKQTENEVQIDWRIVDNASREVVSGAVGRASGLEKGTSFNFNSWGGSGFNNNREFAGSALGKATMKAIAQIVTQVGGLSLGPGARTVNSQTELAQAAATKRSVKGTVRLVDGREVWVSLGTNNGFAPGDKVKIYKPIEKRNKRNELIAVAYEPIAEIILRKVQKDQSQGECSSSVEIAEDWPAAAAEVDINQL